MKIPVQNVYYLLSYAYNRLTEKSLVEIHASSDISTINFLVRLLCGALDELFRSGLDRSYISVSDEIRTIRGKVNVSESIKNLSFYQAFAVYV
ncbi:hypothetical protein [Paenibacillus sp. GP183]|uniref:5-methylcytosine restriction system specificity protein McrC n=1 Tax=Paenibacillus sp. GP183 TaxID=1882751 RepID=UPI0011152A26